MNKMEMAFQLLQLLEPVKDKVRVVGNTDIVIRSFKPVTDADQSSLVFISHDRKDAELLLEKTDAKVVIVPESLTNINSVDKTLIIAKDPRKVFAQIVNKIIETKPTSFIHPSAVIHEEAKIGQNVFIGPLSYIGKAEIGDGCIMYGSNHIYDNVKIGKKVKINAGTVIGAAGFGYLKMDDGKLENFPHIGGVIIEDEVEIGSNTCIDRGALGNTIIRQGAKIDNLVHIAHNVVVGKNSMVIADAMVGGSTIIGEETWIAPSSSLRDGLKIGNNVTIGMGAVITKDVKDNEIWAGNPGRPLEEFLQISKKMKSFLEK